MEKTVYKCEFLLRGQRLTVESEYGPADFMDGFWITQHFQLTKGLDGRYWIPPSCIQHVEKERNDTPPLQHDQESSNG